MVRQRKNKRLFYYLNQFVIYGILGIFVSCGYASIVSGASLLLNTQLTFSTSLLTGVIVFIIALIFQPFRMYLEKILNSFFFKNERALQDRLQSFNSELPNLINVTKISQLLWEYIQPVILSSSTHIYLFDSRNNQFIPIPNSIDGKATDIFFPKDSALIRYISDHKLPFDLSNTDLLSGELKQEQARLKLLGATVFVALPGEKNILGFIALSPRTSGLPYSQSELTYIQSLCHQASLAFERAQAVSTLENRVREMNVFLRISEGVNVTLALDDMLELIYAQTIQIIPSDDFHIILYDKDTKAQHYLFYINNNERLSQFENQYFSGENTLEYEVIQRQQSIITDDYVKECQSHEMSPSASNIHAWICVPLNNGAEAFGALTLAKRDVTITYTPEQLYLLESIANQAAGAIIKTRLLQETQRRAHQFSILNEVSRQLTSTFKLEGLIENILLSAMELLTCDAGSLLMLDEQTDELVFRVATGPVGKELLNKRMPANAGIAGKVATTKQPVIVNNIQSVQEWYSKTDQQTGFKTEGILAIPLMVKEKVIGVLEILNKKDGTPFTLDDQELIKAFSAQAGVAIANAQLYTMTDEELTARVEELSVMQRIDRELNTNLDTTRTMGITLDWAMRQSASTAGFVGIVQENGIKVMASQGYIDELNPYQDKLFSIDNFNLRNVVEKGQSFQNSSEIQGNNLLLHTARSQAVIPISRENNTIGILFLEKDSPDLLHEKKMEFLTRLSDHASIAISNAELYAKVQAANLAKSEFVSFVSHELKNPMTSIKGYTELLAAGAVGQINEAQANFLGTIRGNVDRMATLVSDLADVSRIEAGRLRLEFKSVKVKDVVDETIRSQQRQLDEKKQKLLIDIPEILSPVWADKMRYSQILLNLISNAYKYTPEGGTIHLSAENCENQWDPAGAPNVVHVWVKDDGIGINQEDQKKIFQKFFRAEDSKAREAPGTGLGLNITKYLVEMQGGRIWFESELRVGTTFHFTIPISN